MKRANAKLLIELIVPKIPKGFPPRTLRLHAESFISISPHSSGIVAPFHAER